MTYSRGTDNDKGARRILYEDGVPLAVGYTATCDVDDLNRLIRSANDGEKMRPVLRLAFDLLKAGHQAVIDRANESGDDTECDRYESVLVALKLALGDARPIPSPAAPPR